MVIRKSDESISHNSLPFMRSAIYQVSPTLLHRSHGSRCTEIAHAMRWLALFPPANEHMTRTTSVGGIAVVRLLARSPPAKVNLVRFPAGVVPEFSHLGIVSDDATGRRVFSGISPPPVLAFRRCLVSSSSSDLNISLIDVTPHRRAHGNVNGCVVILEHRPSVNEHRCRSSFRMLKNRCAVIFPKRKYCQDIAANTIAQT
ncbi:hypothetical protein PR048_030347 [Dryococelus australis]|uniref:Uncharacterized protein n=1 Tax=Dryococelus australis TaxID=614101 RepID=A0ABQ9G8R0_9NEOP|nr:hypothetical protein PR048_030347 [Dryococelus australis]